MGLEPPPWTGLCESDAAVASAWYTAYLGYCRVAAGVGCTGCWGCGVHGDVGLSRSGWGSAAAGCGQDADGHVGRSAGRDGVGSGAVGGVGHGMVVRSGCSDDVVDTPDLRGEGQSGGSGCSGGGCGDVGCLAASDGLGGTVGQQFSGDRAGVPGVNARGPNFLRNQASRLKKKMKVARETTAKRVSAFDGCDESLLANLRDSRARLYVLQNERQILQEERVLARLKSPMSEVKEVAAACGVVGDFVEKQGRKSPQLAAWAAKVGSDYAVSVAQSSSVSLGSVTSAASLERKKELRGRPMSRLEAAAVDLGVIRKDALLDARVKCGRLLTLSDFLLPDAPYRLSQTQKVDLFDIEAGLSFHRDHLN